MSKLAEAIVNAQSRGEVERVVDVSASGAHLGLQLQAKGHIPEVSTCRSLELVFQWGTRCCDLESQMQLQECNC